MKQPAAPLPLALLAALALSACGNSTSPTSDEDLARIRAAYQSVVDAGSVRIEAIAVWSGASYSGSSTLTAEVDFAAVAVRTLYTYSDSDLRATETSEDVVVDGIWYSRHFDYAGPNGEWVRDDPQDYEDWDLLAIVDFEFILIELESIEGPVHRLGTRTMGGVDCTGYRVKRQPWYGAEFERSSDVYLRALGQLLREARDTTDIWLDGSGRPCRIATATDPRVAKFAARSGVFPALAGAWTATYEFFDYGQPLTITAPAPEDTVHWESLD